MKDQRQQLRQSIRNARRALSSQDQRYAAEQLCLNLSKQVAVRKASNIAAYLATDGEISPEPLIEWAYANRKKVFVPVLHPLKHHQLLFVELTPDSPMKTNRYGILEPDPSANKIQPLWALDLVFLPLVAFDKTGARLGMGGGYYDRTFAYRAKLTPYNKPTLIGIAHSIQEVMKLSTQSWDIPLSAIATEHDFLTVKKIN